MTQSDGREVEREALRRAAELEARWQEERARCWRAAELFHANDRADSEPSDRD